MELEPLVLLFIIIFFFFLGRLSRDIKIRTGEKQIVEKISQIKSTTNTPTSQTNQNNRNNPINDLDDEPKNVIPLVKIEENKNAGPVIMDFIMTSVMAAVLVWIINNVFEILGLQTSYLNYILYFLAEIIAAYPVTLKSPNDLSVGIKTGLGATILLVLLYPNLWNFFNMLLLAITMISSGLLTSFLVKKQILKKRW